MADKITLVVAGIIYKDDKFLITQRKSTSRFVPNLWEFPGGKVELYENPEDALVREIKEELDIEIKIDSLFDIASHIYEDETTKFHVVMVIYKCSWVSGEVQNIECQDSRWITTKDIDGFTYADADIPAVNKLRD